MQKPGDWLSRLVRRGNSHKVWISVHDEEILVHGEIPDWSWVHSQNFSSITSTISDIGENVISSNTDVTDGWESVIFSRAKSVSNNFTLTCRESSSALWATLHACTCLTPTFVCVEHTPEHGLEKYKWLHWLLLSARTAKFVVEQIALPQTVVFIAVTRSLFCLKELHLFSVWALEKAACHVE